ncbi:DNA helicase UvrD [Thermosulfurimonas marina]|uniref:DNA helicase UvrD n=1 Tax=Thermosulfurimonas marina TaxID=2047767 RepID=A0A6H1WRE8_9BACT|nr:endonuclease Q family protein [Thermosulfurimonas marina]QJA05795.1 DNA helicase UvrD [Thermosulfurimonas marina]
MKANEWPPEEWFGKFYLADLHVHSRFSRATSREMTVPVLSRVAREKGLGLVGTGDFTHPEYFRELGEYLEAAPEEGLYVFREDPEGPRFILSAEISLIFSWRGKGNRRLHLLLLAPSLEVVREINLALSRLGDLSADGRPTLGTPAREVVRLLRGISPEIAVIPAHAWTPWYSLFGSFSGFDSVEECFEEESEHIWALETGLSSDPEMNWRISALDRFTLVSNSDAHSPAKLGREANAFWYPMSYPEILRALKSGNLAFTVEFYPEEGKYHFDGHRACGVLFSPAETRAHGGKCPVCGGELTVGVMHRVEELADRPEGFRPPGKPLSVHLVPLEEIIAEALGVGVQSKRVKKTYRQLVGLGGSEFALLLERPLAELEEFVPERILEGIRRVREGRLYVRPGYDGVYGVVSIFGEDSGEEPAENLRQQSLF